MPSTKNNNIQDNVLNHLRKQKTELLVYLVTGVPLKGRITSFDNFTLVIQNEGKQSLVYKHAISTIVFPKEIETHDIESSTTAPSATDSSTTDSSATDSSTTDTSTT